MIRFVLYYILSVILTAFTAVLALGIVYDLGIPVPHVIRFGRWGVLHLSVASTFGIVYSLIIFVYLSRSTRR